MNYIQAKTYTLQCHWHFSKQGPIETQYFIEMLVVYKKELSSSLRLLSMPLFVLSKNDVGNMAHLYISKVVHYF